MELDSFNILEPGNAEMASKFLEYLWTSKVIVAQSV